MKKLYRGRLLLSTCLTGAALGLAPGALAQTSDSTWKPRAEVEAEAGERGSQVSIELFAPLAQNDANLLFVTGRAGTDEDHDRNGSVTVGGRGRIGADVAIGVNAGLDFYRSSLTSRAQTAASFGIEGFTSVFDVRLNYRMPLNNKRAFDFQDPNVSPLGVLSITNNRLIETKSGFRIDEIPLTGVNGEVGARATLSKNFSLRGSLGAFDYRDDAAARGYRGIRGGIELELDNPVGEGSRFSLGARIDDDNRFGTHARAMARLSIPFGGSRRADRSTSSSGLDRQMGDRVRRDYVTESGSRYTDLTSTSFAVDDRTGQAFGGIYYTNGAAAVGGAGTAANPTAIGDAVTRAGANGVVVALGNAGSINTGGVTLAANQYLLGGASSVAVRRGNGTVTQFGFGGTNGTIVGTNAAGATVTLGQGSVIRDVTIRGAGTGVAANGVGGFALERLVIENTGGAGLSLTNTLGPVVVDGITIRGGAGAGVLINGGSNITLRNSTIGGGAGAIDINDGGAALTTALSNLTLSATGGNVLDIDGSGAGTVTVAGLSGVTIAGGNGETGGFAARSVDFDSSTASGIQAVNAGRMQVGTNAARVNGAGVSLTDVTGALSFTDLDISNNAGTGLTVTNTKTGSFTLTTLDGTVDTTAGTALNLDPLNLNLIFASVSSVNATGAGIILDEITGVGTGGNALTIGTLTITNAGAQGLFITGGSTGLVTITGGSITNSGGASVQIGQSGVAGSGGTIGFNFGASISDSGAGPLISLFNVGGAIRFTGTINGAGPILVNGTTAGSSIGFTGATTLTGASSPAISILNLLGSFSFTGPLTIANPAGDGIVIGTVTGGVTFGDVDITGLGRGTGLDLTNAQGNVTFRTLDISGTGVAGSTGIDLTGATNPGAMIIANPSHIQGVDIGVDLTNASISGSFRFGDGNSSDGLESSITANTPIAITGLDTTRGTYDFADVQLNGNTNNLTGGSFTAYYVQAGAVGSGASASDPGTLLGAEASGAQYIVLLNDPAGGQDVLDATVAGGSLDLIGGQTLVSFLYTDFFSVTGATVPSNLIVSGIGPTGILNPYTGSGAAVLTTTAIGSATVNLSSGSRLDGLVIQNGGNGFGVAGSGVTSTTIVNSNISGNGGAIAIADGGAATTATLTNLNLSATGGTALVLSGAGAGTLSVSGTGITVAATGTAGALNISDVALGNLNIGAITAGVSAGSAVQVSNATGSLTTGNITLGGTGVGAGVSISGNSAGITTGAITVTGSAGDGLSLAGNSGTIALGALNVTGAAGAGVRIGNTSGTISVTGATVSGGMAGGIVIQGVTGAGSVSIGTVTANGGGGTAITVDDADGAVQFTGSTTIANRAGISLGAGSTGSIVFGDVDITGLVANTTGVDARNASGTVTFNTLDIAGASAVGTRGIDLSGATFAGSVATTQSGTITGVGVGVDLTNAAITGSFRYGDGSNVDADGAASIINAVTPIAVGGLNAGTGTYDFRDVNLTGDTSGLASSATLFWVRAGASGAGTRSDPGSIGGAEASGANIVILLNDPTGGSDTIDANEAVLGAGGTFDMIAGQQLLAFLNGDTLTAPGGAPANVLVYDVTPGLLVNPFAGSGAPTLTTTGGAVNTVTVAGNVVIDGVIIANPGGTGVGGAGVANVTIRNSQISGANGAILLTSGAGSASVALSNLLLWSSNNSIALAANDSTAGTMTVTQLSNITIEGGHGEGAATDFFNTVFDADLATAGAQTVNASIQIGTAATRTNGYALGLNGASGALNFTSLSVYNSGNSGLVGTLPGLNLSSSGGTIDTINGNTINVGGANLDLVLDRVAHAGTGSAILLTGVTGIGTGARALDVANLAVTAGTNAIVITGASSGNFTFGAASSISGTTGGAITLSNTAGTLNFTYDGSVTQAANATLLFAANHTGTVTFGASSSLTATNGNGLRFSNADGTYNFNGTTMLNGGNAGVGIINGSAGSFTFGAGTSITSPTGAAISVQSSTASLTYSGSITQANNAALAFVFDHSAGALTFNTGTLSATNGTGLQFSNADGAYNFNGTTTLNGGDAGIDIAFGSDGTFAFGTGTSITSPTGAAIYIGGSNANVTYSGNATQANNVALLSVITHNGTLNFNTGTLSATNGNGLYFADADGNYSFTGTTTLNGGGAGVSVLGGSAGTFAFGANTSITSPNVSAIVVQSSSASLSYLGNVTMASGQGLLHVLDHSAGTITFQTGTLSATNGMGFQLDNADGTYVFNGTTSLSGGAFVDIRNGSAGAFTFGSGATITNPAQFAIRVENSTAGLTYSGTVALSNTGAALGVTNHSGGALNFQAATFNVSNGTGLSFDNADGAYQFGSFALAGGARIALTNGSAGTFTFGDVDITGLAANTTAVDLRGATGNVTFQTLDIAGASATGTRGIDLTGSATAANIIVNESSNISGVGIGVDLTNAAITGNFRYGDGSNVDADGAASTINATVPLVITGLNPGVGTYNFRDVNLVGDTSGLASSSTLYWVRAGANGAGTRTDPGSIGGAEASAAGIVVLLNDPNGGNDTIDANEAVLGAGGTFNMLAGQQMVGFLNGDTIAVPGGAPANVQLFGVAAGVVTNPFAGSGAPTLTTTAANVPTVFVANNIVIDGVIIANGGAGVGSAGVGGVSPGNVTIRNSRISGAGSAIDINGGAAGASSVALSNLLLWSSNGSTALAAYTTGAGSMTVTQLSNITIEGGHGENGGAYFGGAVFDADLTTAGIQTVNASLQVGTLATRVNGNGIILPTATGALHFTSLSIYNSGSGAGSGGLIGTSPGLNLSSSTGTIDSFNSNAISLGATNIDLVLGSVVHAGTGNGLLLTNVTGIGAGGRALDIANLAVAAGTSGITINGASSGNFTFGAASSISGTTGAAINLTNTVGALNLTYNGSVTQAANALLFTAANHTGTVTFGAASSLSATNGTGLLFSNADGTYNFNGTTTLNGGNAGIDIQAGSAGTFVFGAGTSVTSPTGTALDINGSTANVTYSGNLTQANNSALVSVVNHSGGTLTFNTGTLSATNGTGLQFNNADGIYNFNGTTTLNGGDAGIDITLGSAGTFTFGTSASITSPTGNAITIDSSTALMMYSGNVTQASNAALLSVNSHGGTLRFTGTLSATNGTGLQFTDADGSYEFTGTTTLNGGDAGIDILTGSGGSFILGAGTSITNPTGAAITIANSTAGVAYSGNITQANNAALLNVSAHAGGTVTFNTGTLSATNGSGLQFDNADSLYEFFGTTTLNGGNAGVDILNGSAGIFNFGAGASITSPTGTAITIDSSTADLGYAGSVTQANNALLLGVTNHGGGTINFTGTATATNGTGLSFDNADGTYQFGAVALSGNSRIAIVNGSAGTFTFGDVDITGLSSGTAVNLTGATTNVTFQTLDIAATSVAGTTGIDASGTTAANITVSESSNITGVGVGINLTNAAITGTFRYGDGSNLDADGAASNITATTPLIITGLNAGGGAYNFNDVNLNGDTSNLSVSAYFVLNGATGTGTRSDPGSLAGAEAASATYIVLLNNPAGGNDTIDATSAGGSLDLDGGQFLYSFRHTDSFNVGGGAPANVFLYNVQTGIIDNPYALSGAPTLTASGAAPTVVLNGSNVLDGLVVTNSGSGAGISGVGAANVTIRNSTIAGGAGGAINIADGGAATILSLSNLNLAAAGGNILNLVGTGAGTLAITGFTGLTATHTSETGGFAFDDVTFDGDSGAVGVQPLSAGALTLGTSGARITGNALSLTNVVGTLNFTTLNIANTGGTGLLVNNSKANNFTLGTTGGTIDTTSGTAISLDPLTINMILNSVSATGGAYGILLDTVEGSFAVTGAVNVTNSTGDAILIRNNTAQSDPLDVAFQGAVTINNSAARGVVLINNAGASASFTGGLNITTASGQGFLATAGGTVSVTGSTNTISTTGSDALYLSNVTIGSAGATFNGITSTVGWGIGATVVTLDGDLNIVGMTSSGPAGNAGVFSDLTGSGTVNLTGSIDIDGLGLLFGGTLGTINIANTAGSTLTIDGAGRGIFFNGVTGGTVNVASAAGTAAIGATTSTTTAAIAAATGTGTLNYGGTIAVGTGNVLNADGGSFAAINLSGAITSTTAGTAFNFANADGVYTISGSVSHTGGAGVAVDGASGGNITFSNAVTSFSTGSNNAVGAAGTGTLTFSGGGLDIDTTSGTGLSASAGTLIVTGAGNSITTATGQIINLSGVTAGAGGINFASLTSTATVAATAININNLDGTAFSGGAVNIAGTSFAANDGIFIGGGSAATIGFGSTAIAGAGGDGIEINGAGNGAITFSSVTINNTTGNGIYLLNSSGSVTIGGGAIGAVNDPAGTGVRVDGGSGTVVVNASVNKTTAGNVVYVTNRTGGTVTFGGNITASAGAGGIGVVANSGGTVNFTGASQSITVAGIGVQVSVNTGATTNFTGGNLVINASGVGLLAGAGTLNITGSGNSSTSTTSAPISLSGTIVGASGITFASASASNVAGGIFLTNVASSGGGAITLGTVNLQGINTTGIDITGTLGAAVTINDLDIGLNAASAVAFDLNGATLAAAIIANDFDVTSTTGTGTIAVDLRGTTGGQTIRLGDAAAGGASSSIAGVGTGVFLNATTNAAFTFGDGEAATDTGSTISAITAINAANAPVSGTYDFRDVAFAGSPGLGFGIGSIYFIDSNGATGGGNGSGSDGANPGTLAAVETLASGSTDIIVLINNGSAISAAGSNGNDTLALASGVQVRGFGNGVGGGAGSGSAPIALTLTVPSTILFSGGTTLNIADPTGNGAATLTTAAGANAITLGASGNRISGFILDGSPAGAARGIKDNGSGATNTLVSFMTIRNLASAGIEITPSTNTTIDNVTFSGNASDVIVNAAGTTISNVTSTGALGNAFNITNATGTTTLTNVNISSVNGAAIFFTNAAGTINATNVDITNTTGAPILINGGTASFNFDSTSSITQGLTGNTLSVSGGHATGTLTYAGTISATNGNGIQFDNADGTYNFTGSTTLSGGNAGIDILNGSAGAITFANASITSPTGSAVTISNSTAALSYSGNITQANNAALLDISAHSGGTITFQTGMLSGTNGTGLQFDNADGVYNFNGTTTLNGGNAGIDILNGSSGTFTFGAGTTITHNAAGNAVTINASNANLTLNGAITDNNGAAIAIDGHDGGAIAIGASITTSTANTATGLSIQNSNAGSIDFTGQISLGSSSASAAVFLFGNEGGAITFNAGGSGFDINQLGTGQGLLIAGGNTVNVLGANNSITTDSSIVLNLTNTLATNTVANLSFASASNTSGQYGIIVQRSAGTLTGTVNIAGGAITATTTGVSLVGDALDFTYGGAITANGGAAHSVEVLSRTAGTATLSGNITDNSQGILVVGNTGGIVNFTGQSIQLNTQNNQAVTLSTNTGATINFAPLAGGNGLDIVTDNGLGFGASNGGTINVTGTGNTVQTQTGMVVSLDGVSAGASGITFAQLGKSSVNSGAAYRFNNLDGSFFTVTGNTSVNGSGGGDTSLSIGGNSAATFNFGSYTSNNSSSAAIRVDGAGNGTVTFGSVSIDSANAGDAIVINNSDNSVTVNSGSIQNVNFGRGIYVNGGTGNVAIGASVTKTTTGNAVQISGHTVGTITLSGNINSSGGFDNGIVIGTSGGAINLTGQTINLSTGAFNGITVTGAVAGATFNFAPAGGGTGLDIATTSGTGMILTGNGAATYNVAGGANSIATGSGTILNITNATANAMTLNMAFATASMTSGANGILIDRTGGGAITGTLNISGGAITATTRGVDLNGETLNFTYGGTITAASGRSIEVTGHSAGTVTFSGAIADTGQGINISSNTGGTVELSGTMNAIGSGATAGLTVSNNSGGTINFSGATKRFNSGTAGAVSLSSNTGTTINFLNGGLAITTTSGAGFAATGGGTITVQGAVNTIASTTGTALNVANTTIGTSGLTFRSIASNGAPNGILLNATGSSGGLTVTATGSAGTGGTITASTGDGISLTSTENVRLSYMNVTNNLGDGIGGSNINGFLLDGMVISGNGNDAGSDESGINITGLTGTASNGARPTGILNSTISNNNEFEVQIANSSGTLTNFQLTNTAISSTGLPINGNGSSPHGNLVNFLGTGTSVMGITVSGGSFTGNWNAAVPPATITGTGLHVDTSGTSMTANISGATFTNNNAGINVSTGPGSSTLTYSIVNSTFTGQRSTAINDFQNGNSPFNRTVNGTIVGNTIGSAGVVDSGSFLGNGISLGNEGAVNATYLISGNIIRQVKSFEAISVNVGLSGLATGGGTTNLTILNNTISNIGSRAIVIQDNQDVGTPPTIRVNMSGNSFTTIAGQAGNGQILRFRVLNGSISLVQALATAAANPSEIDDANGFNDPTKVTTSIVGTGTITYNQPPPPAPPAVTPLP